MNWAGVGGFLKKAAQYGGTKSGFMSQAGRGAFVGAGIGAGTSLLSGGNILSGAMSGAMYGGLFGGAAGAAGGHYSGYRSSGFGRRGAMGLALQRGRMGISSNGRSMAMKFGTLGGVAGGLIGRNGSSKQSSSVGSNQWSQGTSPQYFQ